MNQMIQAAPAIHQMAVKTASSIMAHPVGVLFYRVIVWHI
jgi:hypothetical protein